MIAAHPGWPAFVKIFHKAAIIKIANASQQIQKTGPGAWPCDE
jgi:peptide methionine sulfoxide reductase MsrB